MWGRRLDRYRKILALGRGGFIVGDAKTFFKRDRMSDRRVCAGVHRGHLFVAFRVGEARMESTIAAGR